MEVSGRSRDLVTSKSALAIKRFSLQFKMFFQTTKSQKKRLAAGLRPDLLGELEHALRGSYTLTAVGVMEWNTL